MKKIKVTWYDINEEILVEHLEVSDDATHEDMVSAAYLKYGGKNTPGPCIAVEVV